MVFTVTVVFFSRTARLVTAANVIAEGARSVEGCRCYVFRARDDAREEEDAETYGDGILDCPIVTLEDIARSDAIIVGAPTTYGRLASEMNSFFNRMATYDADGNALKGKIGSAFTEVGAQDSGYGGHELALMTCVSIFLQHGMIPVGVPRLPTLEVTPIACVLGTTLRASNTVDSDVVNSRVRLLNEAEVKMAYAQGEWASLIAKQLHDDGLSDQGPAT